MFRWQTGTHPSGKFVTVGDDGIPDIWCHSGQDKARKSTARFVLVLSGAQSGKTALGPPWLLDEMKSKGPGNYILVAPTFRLLEKQAVPTLNRFFGTLLKLGQLVGNEFRISEEGHARIWPHLPYEPTRIIFGYAENPDSLESLTAKAAWLDEAGQRGFKQASWEAIQSRLAIHQGRVLFTSTPYEHGWLKADVHDRAERNRKADKEGLPRNPADAGFDSISYESRMNPAFSQAEWDRQKLVLPEWRFSMRYRGLFTRPAGQIYDNFDPAYHVQPADYVPDPRWRIYCGIDFGSPNFSALFLAEEPGTKKRIVFAEYRPLESKKIREHIDAMHKVMRDVFRDQAETWSMMSNQPASEWTRLPDLCVGGAKSEGQWRSEFSAMGWPIREPDQPDVEVGISRVRACFTEVNDSLFVSAACPKLLEEIQNYSREVDDDGEPINDTIADKDTYHGCDALRYIVSYLEIKNSGVGAWAIG